MRLILLSVAFIHFLPGSVYSQDASDKLYRARLLTRASAGINFPLSTLLTGNNTDDLIAYSDKPAYYLQVLTATWFFRKQWGVDLAFRGSSSREIRKRDERFTQSMMRAYDDRYFVNPSTGASQGNPGILGDIERLMIGIVYRKESQRLAFYPALSFGVTSFYADWGNAYLKEKNTNNVLHVRYTPSSGPNDHFTISPSFTLARKLTNKIFVHLDVSASWFKTDFSFTKTVTDVYTDEIQSEFETYSQAITTVSIGAGLTFELF